MDVSLLFFGVFFPCLSLTGAYYLRKAWLLGSASRNWPCVTGRITESKFEPYDDTNRLIIKYKYAVEGKQIQGDTYSYRGFSTDLASVEDIVSRYPVGTDVNVYFDPLNVETSLLEPGVDRGGYLAATLVLCLLFVAGISCMAYVLWTFGMK